MRTKTLVLAAALSVAGLATSMAQSNVYSLNVVGYINVSLQNGSNPNGTFNMIANQLDLDGTGVNNTFNSTLGTNGWVSGTVAYAFAGGGYQASTWNNISKTWGANASVLAALQPGGGIFLKNGNPASAGPTTVTFVGNVLQGNLSTPVASGFQLISSKVPQAGTLTALGLPSANIGGNSKSYQWDAVNQAYNPIRTVNNISKLWNVEPNLAVGEAIFLSATTATNWTRSFTVQ